MPAIHRAFLSYSSNERAIVHNVAKNFTVARVVVDTYNFDDSKFIADEICSHLRTASVLVVFLSEASVNSNWVKFELQQALYKLGSDSIKLIVYIVDDLSLDKVPEWLRTYAIYHTRSALRIAETIEDFLQELEQYDDHVPTFFVGRHEEQDHLTRAISPISAPAPSVIFLGGVEGIGKKTLLSKVVQNSLGNALKTKRLKISLPDAGGIIEFFEMLIEYGSVDTFRELEEQLKKFRSSNEDERIREIVTRINSFSQDRLLVTLVGRYGLITEDGDFQPWLSHLILHLPSRRLPLLAICSSRMVRGEFQEVYQNVVFQPVRNLLEEHSRDLLTLWFNWLQIKATEQEVRDMTALTGGRPYAIGRAAKLASEHTITMVLNRHSLRRVLSLGYDSTLKQIKSPIDKSVIALLLHFERLSLNDLTLAVKSTTTDVIDSVTGLLGNMILENEADHYFVAPHLMDLLSRESWLSDYEDLCKDAAASLVVKIQRFEPDQYVSVVSLNAAVIGAIRRGEILPDRLANLVKPAQLLRVGRKLYDQGRYARSSEILGRALENRQELTRDAIIEGLRLRAMCLARLYHSQPAHKLEFHRIVDDLSSINTTRANQGKCFIRGFQARISSNLTKARDFYRQAIRYYGGDKNYHVLNEYAKVLRRMHDYDTALRYARLALEFAPTNPYVLEVVVDSLIERSRHRELSEDDKDEIERLLEELEVASARMCTCHYQTCISRYYLKLGQREEALEQATAAVNFTEDRTGNIDSDMTFQAHFTRAQCLFTLRRYGEMSTDIEKLDRKIQQHRDFRRFAASVLQLKVRRQVKLKQFDPARAIIKRASFIRKDELSKIEKELDQEEAYATR